MNFHPVINANAFLLRARYPHGSVVETCGHWRCRAADTPPTADLTDAGKPVESRSGGA